MNPLECDTEEQINELIKKCLSRSVDQMAYYAGSTEQFYYILECQRVIRYLACKTGSDAWK